MAKIKSTHILSITKSSCKESVDKMMYITLRNETRCILDEPEDAIKNYINF